MIIPKINIKDTDVESIKEFEVHITYLRSKLKTPKQEDELLECKIKIDCDKEAFKVLKLYPDSSFRERLTVTTLDTIKAKGRLLLVFQDSTVEFNLSDI